MSIPSRLDVPEEGKLLVAFSGGSDSLYLLYVLSCFAKERTVALYVDHNIRSREELAEEIALNQRNAEKLGVPLVIRTIPRGDVDAYAKEKDCGIEAAARMLRYAILQEYAVQNGFAAILTAHHREDQTETVLMRMLEGTPFWAWGGVMEQNGLLCRPMLHVTKAEILETLEANHLVWSEDSTNSDLGYRRNQIRRKLNPVLSEVERQSLCAISENIREINRNMRSIPFQKGWWCEFDTKEFLSAMPQSRERLLFDIAAALSVKTRFSRAFIQQVLDKASSKKGRLEAYGLVFYFSSTISKVYRRMEPFRVPFEGQSTKLPDGFVVDMNHEDALTLEIPAEFLAGSILRTSLPGDKILLCSGLRHVSDFGKEYRHPQSLVLEQNGVIVALFNRGFGGRDRLCSLALGKKGEKVSVNLRN